MTEQNTFTYTCDQYGRENKNAYALARDQVPDEFFPKKNYIYG